MMDDWTLLMVIPMICAILYIAFVMYGKWRDGTLFDENDKPE